MSQWIWSMLLLRGMFSKKIGTHVPPLYLNVCPRRDSNSLLIILQKTRWGREVECTWSTDRTSGSAGTEPREEVELCHGNINKHVPRILQNCYIILLIIKLYKSKYQLHCTVTVIFYLCFHPLGKYQHCWITKTKVRYKTSINSYHDVLLCSFDNLFCCIICILQFCFADPNISAILYIPWRLCWMTVLAVLFGLPPEGKEFWVMEIMLESHTKAVQRYR